MWHINEIWRLIRTGQYAWFWCDEDRRFFGPRYDWYDGPHYAFGFMFFAVCGDDYKDRAKSNSHYALRDLLKKLLNKKFRY